MNFVFQTKFGKEGNCFAACVASLLEIDIDKVPFFGEDEEWSVYEDTINRFLKNEHNLFLWSDEFENWKEFVEFHFQDFAYIVSGDSNLVGFEHAVIYKNGKQEHNPNNSGVELINIKHIYIFLKLHE